MLITNLKCLRRVSNPLHLPVDSQIGFRSSVWHLEPVTGYNFQVTERIFCVAKKISNAPMTLRFGVEMIFSSYSKQRGIISRCFSRSSILQAPGAQSMPRPPAHPAKVKLRLSFPPRVPQDFNFIDIKVKFCCEVAKG